MDIEKIKSDIVEYGLDHNPLMFSWSDVDLGKVMNGCGPSTDSRGLSFSEKIVNHILSDLIPDHGLFVDFTPACCVHDFDYWIGKTPDDKNAADARLETNMKKLIRIQAPSIADEIDQIMPFFYYHAVQMFGVSAFEHKDPV